MRGASAGSEEGIMTCTVDRPQIITSVIDGLAERIGETCATKGFREDWEMADYLERLADQLERDGYDEDDEPTRLRTAANTLRNCVIATKLALVCSEIGEALETLRDHGVNGILAGEGNFGEEL